jgi:Fe-S cluster biogenesis protein NfuA
VGVFRVSSPHRTAGPALRGRLRTRRGGFRYQRPGERAARTPTTSSWTGAAQHVLIDPPASKTCAVDFVETGGGGGLQINNPNPVWREPLALRVQEIIDTQINPGVGTHGGWVELLGVRDNKAFIRLGGGCQGCGMADVTLKQGIETMIFAGAPEITQVIDETDHAAGENPYYRPAKGAA